MVISTDKKCSIGKCLGWPNKTCFWYCRKFEIAHCNNTQHITPNKQLNKREMLKKNKNEATIEQTRSVHT